MVGGKPLEGRMCEPEEGGVKGNRKNVLGSQEFAQPSTMYEIVVPSDLIKFFTTVEDDRSMMRR